MRPTLVVTRPQAEANRWAKQFQEGGWSSVILPLISFGPPRQAQALELARSAWPTYSASMWVSPQAVESFVSSWPSPFSPGLEGGKGPRAAVVGLHSETEWHRFWAPGPGTARALVRAGAPLACIDQPDPLGAQFDSDALWERVAHQVTTGFRLLLVHGEAEEQEWVEVDEGKTPGKNMAVQPARERLAARVRATGGQVDWCAAYRRDRPQWGEEDTDQAFALAQPGAAIWLFSSSEAIGNLGLLMPGVSWGDCQAIATHPRIARAARSLGFGRVETCKPTPADVQSALADMVAPKMGRNL